jgi:hypothetical protein
VAADALLGFEELLPAPRIAQNDIGCRRNRGQNKTGG